MLSQNLQLYLILFPILVVIYCALNQGKGNKGTDLLLNNTKK